MFKETAEPALVKYIEASGPYMEVYWEEGRRVDGKIIDSKYI